MDDGSAWSLAELSELTGDPQASISARIRDLRKEEFGSHVVLRLACGRVRYRYKLMR
jgi:hypothetical protein